MFYLYQMYCDKFISCIVYVVYTSALHNLKTIFYCYNLSEKLNTIYHISFSSLLHRDNIHPIINRCVHFYNFALCKKLLQFNNCFSF